MATTDTTTEAVPTHVRAAMVDALAYAEAAQTAWGCWADEVRQRVEKRLGVEHKAGDPRVLADPEYAAVLDYGAPIVAAVRELRRR